jgi:hypothetical protein
LNGLTRKPLSLQHLFQGPAELDFAGHDRARAGAADEIDRDGGFAQSSDDADVSEAADLASAQREPHGPAGEDACDLVVIGLGVEPQAMIVGRA